MQRRARPAIFVIFLLLVTESLLAVVIRHDREDRRYRELGRRYAAAVGIVPDGAGVLVGSDWVLTAAHVARGVARRSPRVLVEGREIAVTHVFVHPDWSDMGPHDVALLRLAEPVRNVVPAKLWVGDDEVGQVVTFVGHGDTGTGLTGPKHGEGVKRGATNAVERADEHWLYFTFEQPPAGTDLEGVSGPGDSGGPALVERDGTLYTLGVSVFADGRGKGPGRYGVLEGYTRVSTHRAWIESVLAGKAGPGEEVRSGSGDSRTSP